MYKNMLPIGSVVLLKEGEKRVMICSRVISNSADQKIYDYAACLYPEGIVDSDNLYFFNRDAIDLVFFLGFQDVEEIEFRKNVLDQLGEVEIRDGVIVSKVNEE